MLNILTDSDSAVNQFMYEMRHKDIQINRGRFRNNLKRLGMAMALKISEKFLYKPVDVVTPLGVKKVNVMEEQPVLITILRAGSPYLEGFMEIFDASNTGFIGAYRVESETKPTISLLYEALPETQGKDVILIDPMLATGQSMLDAAKVIDKNGRPNKIYFTSAVAAPEGIEYLKSNCMIPFEIWIASLDDHLDHRSYIVPGLGDAGDLSFGHKI